jgi:hypothetical protein
MTDILDNAFGRFLVNVTVPFVKLYSGYSFAKTCATIYSPSSGPLTMLEFARQVPITVLFFINRGPNYVADVVRRSGVN